METETTFNTPHLDFIETNKIDITDEKTLGKTLSKALVAWKEGFDEREKQTDLTFKNQWGVKLEKLSHKLLSDLEKKYKYVKDSVAEKKSAEKKSAEKKPAEKKPAEKKKETKTDTEPEKVNKPQKKNSENEAEKILDSLWSKSENGELKMTEDELDEAGISPWRYLKFFSGEIGKYKFKSRFGSEIWTITKPPVTA